jgi:DNA-binding response OmpR family regulator
VRARLVVVADDRARAARAAQALRGDGYVTAQVVEGLDELERNSIAVVAARGLPRALDACRQIRARLLAATILLFAAADGPAAALQAGADLYWSSDWGASGLGLQLETLARRDARTPGPDPAVRGLWVRGDTLWLHGRKLDIRGKPLELARYLTLKARERINSEQHGRSGAETAPVVPRLEIARVVWRQATVSDHSLDQAVHLVREALAPEKWRLVTVSGEGYWMNVL